jgi:hypothetical protein
MAPSRAPNLGRGFFFVARTTSFRTIGLSVTMPWALEIYSRSRVGVLVPSPQTLLGSTTTTRRTVLAAALQQSRICVFLGILLNEVGGPQSPQSP